MPLETSADAPVPVRQVSLLIDQWISRLGAVWVEGQLAQINRRPGVSTVFMTLRDPVADVSLALTCARTIFDGLASPPVEGARVVVQAKPDFYAARGTLSLRVLSLQLVGLGDLLAQLERRRQLLAAEGLFNPALKRTPPRLPVAVGLVTAPNSAAERDVVENARRRWPAVRIETAYASMQGPRCAGEVIDALHRLDHRSEVEVIVVARGGGSVEDLLPFSDESLIRAVHALRTPVISAIGHDQDQPLLDLVADVRASTPTDAAKLAVPDVADELAMVAAARHRLRQLVTGRIATEQAQLDAIRTRPCLTDPARELQPRYDELTRLGERAARAARATVEGAESDLGHRRQRLRALSPLATLERGYAVVLTSHADPAGRTRAGAEHPVTSVSQVPPGTPVSIRVADGRVHATIDEPSPTPPSAKRRTRSPGPTGKEPRS